MTKPHYMLIYFGYMSAQPVYVLFGQGKTRRSYHEAPELYDQEHDASARNRRQKPSFNVDQRR